MVTSAPGKRDSAGVENGSSTPYTPTNGGQGSSVNGKNGYSIGSGLKSIAEGSAQLANDAVANQHTAARQAAFEAHNTHAQNAINVSRI